jgi:hypothetical protein
MKIRVRYQGKLKRNGQEITIEPGTLVALPNDVAIELIRQGRAAPLFAVKIWSNIFRDFLWAVGSSQDMEGIEPGDFPIYQWQEIQQLIHDQVEPEKLRATHNAKRIFPGTTVICEKK